MFSDPSGKFVVTTTTLVVIGGAIIFGVVGGAIGNHQANQRGATGWDRAGWIAGGVAIGAACGAIIGWFAAPAVVSATGVGAVAITSSGVTTISASTGTVGMMGYQFGNATLKPASTAREALLRTAQNPQLRNAINQLYRPTAHIGDGGTAAKLVNEFSLGATKHTAQHFDKATNKIKYLQRIYRADGHMMSGNDLEIMHKLIEDLRFAVSLFN